MLTKPDEATVARLRREALAAKLTAYEASLVAERADLALMLAEAMRWKASTIECQRQHIASIERLIVTFRESLEREAA
jgi:hypothetical protein